ncbi:hypothetical protein [Enterococcus canintestini]|uniref:Uncharacterized protein n=1 Tax=Enterococcus canintestini TaxID=317010 RepID=A0A267HPN3_9ENTE|nr:hypothetical protein [Enterococcus canintestini]PAB00294.1 hypothetical protein AKL21_09910 [Enterococcus canintestini]
MKKKRKVIFPCMILFGLLTNTFTSSIPVFAAINSTNDSKETTLSTGKIRKKLNSTLNGELEKGGTESSSESRETEPSTVTSTDSQTKSNETQSVTDNTTDTTDEKDSSIDSTTKKAAKTSLSSNGEDSKQENKKVSNAVAPKNSRRMLHFLMELQIIGKDHGVMLTETFMTLGVVGIQLPWY